MEFSLAAINLAQQTYTGIDFPLLVATFEKMGITQVITNIDSGITRYERHNGTILSSPSFKTTSAVAARALKPAVQLSLAKHQRGDSDFPAFCEEIAAAGIAYWIIDTKNLTCDYYTLDKTLLLSEAIPKAVLPTPS
ncbi:MAG: DUF1398 family protein [Culicoidibacterales bacterium]